MNARHLKPDPDRFRKKESQVGVVGLGYVGLPLALLFAKQGLRVTGFDLDLVKIKKLQSGQTYIRHIPPSLITAQKQNFTATASFRTLRKMDAIIICVPTPLDEHRQPDLHPVRAAAAKISQYLRPGQLVVLESTTYPGTTQEVVLPILAQSGLRCTAEPYLKNKKQMGPTSEDARSFLLAFSPEREDPGNILFERQQIPKVIGGINGPSASAASDLYGQVFDRLVLVSSTDVAEMAKLLENIYRGVNIGLINELKLLCHRMRLDVWEVIEAAKTKPFGFHAFYPGPGLGGHCIPVDPFYLSWKAREYDFPLRFIELAGEINSSMPSHVVSSLAEALENTNRCLNGAKVLVMGVAYKEDVDDCRESPSLRIISLLKARKAQVDYHDPYFPNLRKAHEVELQGMSSIKLTAEVLGQYAAVVIATAHSSYDFQFVVRHARLVLDTRNATRDVRRYRHRIHRC